MRIQGLESLRTKLRALSNEGKRVRDVIVGFTAAYAVYVHENLEARHPNGQAKFLEEAARTIGPKMADLLKKYVKAGMGMEKALFMCGLLLQGEAQRRCPVDTGNLKGSAFTRYA